MRRKIGVLAVPFFLWFCSAQSASGAPAPRDAANLNNVLMPAAQLATIKAALPQISDPNLVTILNSPQTLWYDNSVMSHSYQDSVGANTNTKWPDLVAASDDVIDGIFDRTNLRFQFPFGTVAGTDKSTNLQAENFVYFPLTDGQLQPITITTVIRNENRPEWTWTYPAGTVFGEILFITDGANILPTEIRTRTRTATGWATNAFRPFPKASDLSTAIQQLRPNWSSTPSLSAMVAFLGDNSTLTPTTLAAQGGIASTFSQSGYLDTLPDFGDDDLVRTLLTTTPFRSAYDTNWKQNGTQVAYAASTTSPLSIVPTNYTAGLIQVTDDSCIRCHQDGGRLMSDFYFDLYLYGEMWGKDGIFTFHPYDESLYPELRLDNIDNRGLNPKLQAAGIFQTDFSTAKQRNKKAMKKKIAAWLRTQ